MLQPLRFAVGFAKARPPSPQNRPTATLFVSSACALRIWPESLLAAQHPVQCSDFGLHRGLTHTVLVRIKAHKYKIYARWNQSTATHRGVCACVCVKNFPVSFARTAAVGNSTVLASHTALPEFLINYSSAIKSHSDCVSLTISSPKILAALRQEFHHRRSQSTDPIVLSFFVLLLCWIKK